ATSSTLAVFLGAVLNREGQAAQVVGDVLHTVGPAGAVGQAGGEGGRVEARGAEGVEGAAFSLEHVLEATQVHGAEAAGQTDGGVLTEETVISLRAGVQVERSFQAEVALQAVAQVFFALDAHEAGG